MSDEQQASAPPEIAELPETLEASPAADAYGQPLSPQREQELQDLLDAWNAPDADHGERRGPFDGVPLTGAEVSWLAERVRNDFGFVPDLHLEGAALTRVQLQGANLRGARLQGAVLNYARLQGADLTGVQLQGAYLTGARLQGAYLHWVPLEGAHLNEAQLEGANLSGARLQGANLSGARLQGANLSGATLDSKTTLANAFILAPEDTRPLLARLLRRPRYGPALGDLHWGDFDMVQLTQLQGWDELQRLADERGLSRRSDASDHRDAVRAYRQVAQRLRDQGFSDVADRLSDRAQVLQRKLLFRLLQDLRRSWRLPGNLVRWLFSWFLALLAGYGYHPGRSVFWYFTVVIGFVVLYLNFGHIDCHVVDSMQVCRPFRLNEAVVYSLTSFHGRGFFPGSLELDDPVVMIAAFEAVLGLLIEISFIATFTQRFFGAK
jgi:Pentapeptide repeats (8 copies)